SFLPARPGPGGRTRGACLATRAEVVLAGLRYVPDLPRLAGRRPPSFSSISILREDRNGLPDFPARTGADRPSAASGGRPAGVAFAAGAAADERELAALRARVALVALQPGLADLVLQRLGQHGGAGAAAFVAGAVAGVRQGPEVPAARGGEGGRHRL